MPFDFHTHDFSTPPGCGIVNLPKEFLCAPSRFQPTPGALYSAGIHPWWTAEDDFCALLPGLEMLLQHPQVVCVGECGFDRLRGAAMTVQEDVFDLHVALSEALKLPVTIHCVRAFDVLLAARKRLQPTCQWTVHGFRGNASLARQLLDAGLHLSFGKQYNQAAFDITPPDCRHLESDAED